jgi:hypothetical protein
MPKTHRKRVIPFCLLLLSALFPGSAQEPATPSRSYLIPYIQGLENKYDIKFSFVDKDISDITIKTPQSEDLEKILEVIEVQTQLLIKKLSPRYYTISKSSTVDICAIVLDNFEENTASGASIEVIGSSITTITDLDGKFTLSNIPRNAFIRIRHIGFKTQYVAAEELLNQNQACVLVRDNRCALHAKPFIQTGLLGMPMSIKYCMNGFACRESSDFGQ